MTAPNGETRLCTFEVGDLLLGVPVSDVVEVVRDELVTTVPLASHAVGGILYLRGRIVAAVDARRRLGLADRPAGADAVHVIIKTHGEAVSLVVDREGEVVTVSQAARQDVPETLDPTIRSLLTGAYQQVGPLLLVLDPQLALAVD
jgi:purine-binding chemotaxis protein CheW